MAKGLRFDWKEIESLKANGKSYKEICESTGISYGTVTQHFYHHKNRIKNIIQKVEEKTIEKMTDKMATTKAKLLEGYIEDINILRSAGLDAIRQGKMLDLAGNVDGYKGVKTVEVSAKMRDKLLFSENDKAGANITINLVSGLRAVPGKLIEVKPIEVKDVE